MAGRVVVATRNPGKVGELRALLTDSGYEAIGLDEAGVVDEPGDDVESLATFEENALAKARWYFARAGGMAVLADDSGLEVMALGGVPGTRSRRWAADVGDDTSAGEDAANNRRLAMAMGGQDDRRAVFACAVAWVDGVRELVARGTVEGRIAEAAVGSCGFGYDPWFVSDELGHTFGIATAAEKARVSHRARAVAALLLLLSQGVDAPPGSV